MRSTNSHETIQGRCSRLFRVVSYINLNSSSLRTISSGVLVRTFGAALLLLLLLSGSLAAQTKPNNWLKGTWEGTGYQTDDKSTWTMLATVSGRRVSIEYPSLGCGGRWQLISINGNRARFRERLDHGQEKCANNGNVTIQRLNRRQVFFLYRNAGTREVTASAVLNRK